MRDNLRRRLTRRLVLGLAAALLAAALGITIAVAQVLPNPTNGGYPGNRYPQPLRLGMWDTAQFGSVIPYGQDLQSDKTYWGLSLFDAYSDILVYDAKGKFYLGVQVEYHQNGGMVAGPLLALQSTPSGMVPLPCVRPIVGPIQETPASDDHLTYSGIDTAGQRQSITFGPRRYEWTSTDPNNINLTGYLPTPSIPYLLSWRDPKGGTNQLYANLAQYMVTGTLCGVHVHGFTQQEHYWGPGGYGLSWWGSNKRGVIDFFTNKYSDGTIEHGIFFCGEYGARGAMVVNNKGQTVLQTGQINATTFGKNNLSVKYDLGGYGPDWESINEPTQSVKGTDVLFGTMERVGEKRKIVEHVNSYEIYGICDHRQLAGPGFGVPKSPPKKVSNRRGHRRKVSKRRGHRRHVSSR